MKGKLSFETFLTMVTRAIICMLISISVALYEVASLSYLKIFHYMVVFKTAIESVLNPGHPDISIFSVWPRECDSNNLVMWPVNNPGVTIEALLGLSKTVNVL